MLNQLQRGNEPALLRCHHSVFLRRPYLEQLAAGEEGLDPELEALCSLAGRGNSGGERSSRDQLYSDRLECQRGA
jgi:hypothetical protein